MKIIFMGTPDFAVESLDILIKNNYDIVAVVTVPDKPAGRGQQVQQSAVKKYAVEKGLTILQPDKLKDETFLNELRQLKADLQIVVAFRMLPEVVWNMPPMGTINLHGSLLPQYRGAAPINRAIMNGEKETGVSTFFLQHEIDTGKIILQKKTPIEENDNAGTVHDKLMHNGASLILKTVKAIESHSYPQIDQNTLIGKDAKINSAPKIFKEDCIIPWHQTTKQVYNFIRGLSPYPAAYTILCSPKEINTSLKVFMCEKQNTAHSALPGSVHTDSKTFLKIACADGYISLLDIQLAGKKRMPVTDFLRGFPMDNTWKTSSEIAPK